MKKSPKNWIVISTTVFAFLLIALTIILLQNAAQVNAEAAATHFTSCAFNTGNNASVLVPLDVSINGNFALEAGDEIAVYTANGTLCAGVTTWTGTGNVAVAAWGDNDLTPAVDGLLTRETMQYRIWDQSAATEIIVNSASYESGYGQYEKDGTYVMTSLTVASDIVFISSSARGSIADIKYQDEDIIGYDTGRDVWFMYLQFSDVGVFEDVDAFFIMDNGHVLVSFLAPVTIDGIGSVADVDILEFTPTSTGYDTSGTWSMYFDGSDVGMDTANHDIDAIGMTPDGSKLLISTSANVTIGVLSARREDLMAFTPTSLGDTTAGSWERYLDGSDVELSDKTENIRAAWVDSSNGDIYLSTLGVFAVTGASGDQNGVLRCDPGSTGETSSCTYNTYWDGTAQGFSALHIDGLSIRTISSPDDIIYLSSSRRGKLSGRKFQDEDILAYYEGLDLYAVYLQISDVGVQEDVDAFFIMDNGDVLVSFLEPVTVDGVGPVEDVDILKLIPTSTGYDTSGTWSMYFDGSDVGLDTANHDIDAIGMTPDRSKLLISTAASVTIDTLSARREDLMAFTPTSLGETTAGSWEHYFDGSDVGFDTKYENIRAAWVDSSNGDIYLSTLGVFEVPGASGDSDDILRCVPGSLGTTTSCTFNKHWDGSNHGFAGVGFDGLSLPLRFLGGSGALARAVGENIPLTTGVDDGDLSPPVSSPDGDSDQLGSVSRTRQPKN